MPNTSLLLQTAKSIIARFVGVGLNFGVTIAITRNLPRNDAGMLLMMMTLTTGVAVFSRLGVEQWLIRDVAGLPPENLRATQARYLNSAYRVLTLSSSIFVGLWILSSPILKISLFDDEIQTFPLLLSALGVLFFNLIFINAAFMKAAHRVTQSLLTQNALPATAMLVLMVFFWQVFPQNQTYLWLYTTSLALAGAFSLLWLKPWWPKLLQIKTPFTLKEILHDSLPLALISYIAFLMLWADTIATSLLLDNAEVALYIIAARLSFIINIFVSALDATIYPRLIKTHRQNPPKLTRMFWQSTVLLAAVLGLMTILMGITGKFILWIFRPEYVQASQTMLILLVAQAIRGLGLTFSLMFIIQKQVRYLNTLMFIALVVNIFANFLLIPKYGIEGAASATLIANSFLTGGVAIFFLQKRLLNYHH